ncbi:MAG: hypothetical protein N4A33_08970 [Bacteriovoracaceae bacterium]|jgi:hypothetical protein|nr:hypothetical protein [Bacteriovoracaceae bacterium]
MKFLILILFSISSFGQIKPFMTTRMISTGGAGVASILSNESSILNPASIVFVPVTNFYYQRGTSKTTNASPNRSSISDEGLDQIYLISDTSSQLKGTLSYKSQSQNGFARKQYSSSVAALIGKQTSMGVIYHYTKDNLLGFEEKFHQATVGLTYIHSKKLTFGFRFHDPFKTKKEESLITSGFQVRVFSSILYIQDFSFSPIYNMTDTLGSLSAIQLRAFKDIYLRFGKYNDKNLKQDGFSYGISWIGPRLSVEYALMKGSYTENTNLNFKDEEDIRSSLSISVVN